MSEQSPQPQVVKVTDLVQALKAAEVKGAKAEQKPSYHKVVAAGTTLGFVRSNRKGISANVPVGHGAYDNVKVATVDELPALIERMTVIAAIAADAKKAKPKPEAKTTGRKTSGRGKAKAAAAADGDAPATDDAPAETDAPAEASA